MKYVCANGHKFELPIKKAWRNCPECLALSQPSDWEPVEEAPSHAREVEKAASQSLRRRRTR